MTTRRASHVVHDGGIEVSRDGDPTVILDEDEQQSEGSHPDLEVEGYKHEEDEGDDAARHRVPHEAAVYKFDHRHHLHDEGLDACHVAHEDAPLELLIRLD